MINQVTLLPEEYLVFPLGYWEEPARILVAYLTPVLKYSQEETKGSMATLVLQIVTILINNVA